MRSQFALSLLTLIATVTATSSDRTARLLNIVDIKQTLSLFPILIDQHRYSELDQVFAKNASVDWNSALLANGTVHGLSAIQSSLGHLENIKSQHAYSGTQYVNFTSPSAANVTTYFTGFFYGQGSQQGQFFENFGTYEASVIDTTEGWRMTYLSQVASGQFGNLSVVEMP